MNRKEYKQAFDKERYERIELKVPKGMKDIIKSLAVDNGMSVNAYIQDLSCLFLFLLPTVDSTLLLPLPCTFLQGSC